MSGSDTGVQAPWRSSNSYFRPQEQVHSGDVSGAGGSDANAFPQAQQSEAFFMVGILGPSDEVVGEVPMKIRGPPGPTDLLLRFDPPFPMSSPADSILPADGHCLPPLCPGQPGRFFVRDLEVLGAALEFTRPSLALDARPLQVAAQTNGQTPSFRQTERRRR
jgi:hypothetical protein